MTATTETVIELFLSNFKPPDSVEEVIGRFARPAASRLNPRAGEVPISRRKLNNQGIISDI